MKLKYLLIMHCGEQGYWDTSGYCHWSKPAFYKTEQFELNQKEGLIKCLAEFIEQYPQGEYEIHLVHPYKDWDYDDYTEWKDNCEEQESQITSIEEDALLMSKKIAEQKKIEEREKVRKEKDIAIEREKQRELKLLAQLKEKYEHNSRGE